ncbi:MAG: recombinase family protein [Chloroflexi bacterium]|nr:recombinase family protein [Chloroflexota bacterium]
MISSSTGLEQAIRNMEFSMGKRAVIYVRTSSEQQGEKCSPAEQESDCRQYAEKLGLVVVNVYRDIERYRVKNKWVEPSGTRYDRPGMLAMLRDATDDQFDVIIAWREDRLYRGMRAMLLILETIQQHNLTIMLALETFDPTTAPLKAWLAQVELENIKERMTMGVKARLKSGKANSGQDRYGYRRVRERIEIVPEEAEWVRQIFAWYIERIPSKIMRKRLIAANAPQKGSTKPRKITWSIGSILGILQGAEEYATGKKIQRREGERYEMDIEPILDAQTYHKYLLTKPKPPVPAPASVKQYSLIQGLLYCACGYRWQPRGTTSHSRTPNGNWVKKQAVRGVYFCPCNHEEIRSPECPRTIPRIDADREVWRQVCNAINHPDILLDGARSLVAELIHEANSLDLNREHIQKELENLFLDRQWVITQARIGNISEEEMERRLNEYSQKEVSLKSELSGLQKRIDERLFVNWEAKMMEFLADLQDGVQALRDLSVSEDEWLKSFDLKKQIVQSLVEKVTIDVNRNLIVTIHLNLMELLEESLKKDDGGPGSSGSWPKNGTPTKSDMHRKPSLFGSRSGYVSVRAIWNN